MTLVFDKPREGPATHALIIAVDEAGAGVPLPYRAATSAVLINDWLSGHYRSPDAPLASVDLLSYGMPNLPATAAADAVRQWRERLQSHEQNVAFFYFAGPTIDHGNAFSLVMPEYGEAGDRGTLGVQFRNLWLAMAASAAHRQLYFIDGFATRSRIAPAELLPFETVEPSPKSRARFYGRTPSGWRDVEAGQRSPFAASLEETLLAGSGSINARALGENLNLRLQRRLKEAGLGETMPVADDYEGNLIFSYGGGPDPRQASVAPEGSPDGMPAARDKSAAPTIKAVGPAHPRQAAARPSVEKRSADALTADLAKRAAELTDQERELLRLVHSGHSSKQIAKRRGVEPAVVDATIKSALRRIGVRSRRAAADLLAIYEAEHGARAESDKRTKRTSEHDTHFVSDDPEVERDDLDRGPLAIALGRRLHQIWCRSNGIRMPGMEGPRPEDLERAAFVLHVDAPWGGGKTSFANLLARVLNPFPAGSTAPAKFLVERAGSDAVGTIFIDDPPTGKEPEEGSRESGKTADWPEDARRPWIIVPFNAWQAEHCAPPWWVFYQAIRKGCFRAVWREGRFASGPAQSRAPPRPFIEERLWNSALLWRRELWWRLRNPKVLIPLATSLVAAILALLLLQFDIIAPDDDRAAFNVGNAAGLVFAAVTVFGWLWGVAALFTESMTPGLDAAAERRNLGSGDPFERFRRHFRQTIAAVKRPVMVIVDDLDRCRPEFVVDLVRGIQTLLRSPRVVFVILGDRDWIERAFEAHHDAMKKVNVGPEQTFGARFVEKAIQMSFVLPEMPKKKQDTYVRMVLLGPGVEAAPDMLPAAPPELRQDLRAEFRVAEEAETKEARKAAEDDLVEKYAARLQQNAAAASPASKAVLQKGAKEEVKKLIAEEKALGVIADEGRSLLHQLGPLARFFPANPRQIKRIVNAITMYTCVAYLQEKLEPGERLGLELAIWVIVMTEWPDSWRLLATWPELADLLAEKDPEQALAALADDRLPGSRAVILQEVRRIRGDARLFALITEESPERPRLRSESVRLFTELTPLYSRVRRLTDDGRVEVGS